MYKLYWIRGVGKSCLGLKIMDLVDSDLVLMGVFGIGYLKVSRERLVNVTEGWDSVDFVFQGRGELINRFDKSRGRGKFLK